MIRRFSLGRKQSAFHNFFTLNEDYIQAIQQYFTIDLFMALFSCYMTIMQIMQNNIKDPLLKKQLNPSKKQSKQTVTFLSLFKYADIQDKIYMLIGVITSLAAGCTMPLFTIFFSQITSIFTQQNRHHSYQMSFQLAIKLFIVGLASWILSKIERSIIDFIGLYCWSMTGSRQTLRMKKLYYKVLIDQQVAWYDANDVNKLSASISSNMAAIQNAMGQKLSILLSTIMVSAFGLIYAYFTCWQLSLVLTGFLPFMLLGGSMMMKAMVLNAKRSKSSFEDASGRAQQAFSTIKTIKSLTGQKFQLQKFIQALSKSKSKVIKYTFLASGSLGLMNLIFQGIYSFGFWYGKSMIIWYPGHYQAPIIVSTFMCFLMGGVSIGQISPFLKNIADGRVAASKVYGLISRQKTLTYPQNGKRIQEIDSIVFKNVDFKYRKIEEFQRSDKPIKLRESSQGRISQITQYSEIQAEDVKKQFLILEDLNMLFQKNRVNAIVGESGSGKSTIIQLLMRYYDPIEGQIQINGINLKEVDIRQYRKKIGYVGQEPALFSMTIAENLRLAAPNLSDNDIQVLLRRANAWEFVKNCENGINTYVGSSGAQLSGGQKQRIAIARALARNPQIIILDEATSALDRRNQKEIQQTLNNLSQGNITTIVIAHRLTTIKNANNIFVMKKGKLVEEGKHEQLFRKQGIYHDLVKSQNAAHDKQMSESIQIGKQEQEEDIKENKQILAKKVHSKEKLDSVFWKLLKQCRGNYTFVVIGTLSALAYGGISSLYSLAFSNILALMSRAEEKSSEIDNYCLLFLAVAILGGFTSFFYQFNFGLAGQNLVFSLRKKLFHKLLKMPVSFYDQPLNTPGGLSTKLSQDSYQIHNMITGILAVIFLNLSTLGISLFLAFYSSWQLSLSVLALSPLLVFTTAINVALLRKITKKAEKHQKQIGSLISDTVTNVRTVKSFGNEEEFCHRFNSYIDSLFSVSQSKALKSSIVQGFSRANIILIEGVTFWIAGELYQSETVEDASPLFVAIFAILVGAKSAGQNTQFMPDIGKAQNAGANIFQILESEDEFQKAKKMEDRQLSIQQGQIEFKDVSFRYPSRETLVLNNFSLKIKKGEKIGLVGPSGSGKSTLIQILMRFYEIESGVITLNGQDIKKYNLKNYRKMLGLVSQEPTLFFGTVKQNILYNLSKKKQSSILKVAKKTHSLQFINQWEQKFEKQVGQKGSQISGGQKQRIALMRCLLRKPSIFLLDEFTSALDADTERIVFNQIKKQMRDKTTISIAHRLCTIQDADRIIVMRDGKIIEEGQFEKLIERKEYFYKLVKGLD